MKKLYALIAVAALCSSTAVYAQDWTEMMKDHNANVHDVQKAFNTWYTNNDNQLAPNSRSMSGNPGDDDDGDANYMLFKRWEWMMVPRTYPNGKRPDMNSIASQYQDFLNKQATKRANNVQAIAKWSYAGVSNIPSNGGAGRLNRIRINPNNSNILYACSPSGGLWISTNGGTSWSTKTDHLPALGVSDIAFDPTNSNIMYLATGDGDGIGGGFTTPSTIGVFKSTDGGSTWVPTGLYYPLSGSGPTMMTVNEILVDPANHNYIFAACSFGLYFSPNAGLTWNLVKSNDFKDIAFAPGDPSVMYATTSTAEFYRSWDGGMSFAQISLPSSSGAGRIAVAVTPADSNYVYVLADKSSTFAFLGLWLSKDKGQTFTLQSSSPNLLGFSPSGFDNVGQGWYTLSLAASPTNANEIIVGGVNVWRSVNAGATWKLNADQTGTGAPYIHADIHHLLYENGTTYFAATDGGLFKTSNSGTNWSDLSNGLEISEQYSIGLSASVSTEWLTGWQDNGTNLASGASWKESLGGDGMICFIDNTNNSYMYGETYQGGFNMSSNGGGSWKGIAISTSESSSWVTPWLQDPNASQTLYGGYENVWKSTNRGTSWSKISTWGVSNDDIIALAVAPSNSQYIYAAKYGSLHVTANGGTSWTDITAGLPTGSAALSNLAVCSTNPKRVWVTISGYSAPDKVYESDNAGGSWTDISTGLPNLPVNCIAYQGNGIDAMYVGTDVGVYYRDTTNTGGAWISYNSGLPNVSIADLKIYTPSGMLRAATYGRGTWQVATYTAPTSAPTALFMAHPATICANNPIQFTDTSSNEPTSWNWTFTGGTPSSSTLQNPSVYYSAAGTYAVSLKATNGFGTNTLNKTAYITVNALPPTPTISQSGSLISCTPTNLPYYQWFRNNAIIGYDTTYQFWTGQTGVFKVTVSNSDGCSASATKVITVLGVNEVSQDNNIKVYPNPTSGAVTLSFNVQQEGDYTLTLANVLGQTVYSDKLHLNGPVTKNINMANYGKGIYMLAIEGNNTKVIKKIVVY